jgi:hypothetical protein
MSITPFPFLFYFLILFPLIFLFLFFLFTSHFFFSFYFSFPLISNARPAHAMVLTLSIRHAEGHKHALPRMQLATWTLPPSCTLRSPPPSTRPPAPPAGIRDLQLRAAGIRGLQLRAADPRARRPRPLLAGLLRLHGVGAVRRTPAPPAPLRRCRRAPLRQPASPRRTTLPPRRGRRPPDSCASSSTTPLPSSSPLPGASCRWRLWQGQIGCVRRSRGSHDFWLPGAQMTPESGKCASFRAGAVLGDRLVQIRLPRATELELNPCQTANTPCTAACSAAAHTPASLQHPSVY